MALSFYQQVSRDYPDGQLYARPLYPADSADSALGSFLLGLSSADATLPKDGDDRRRKYERAIRNQRVAIIVDAAPDAAYLERLAPVGPGSLLIATSREDVQDWHGLKLRLRPLTKPADLEMLASLIGPERVWDERLPTPDDKRVDERLPVPEAKTIVEMCRGLPLAIKLVRQPGFVM